MKKFVKLLTFVALIFVGFACSKGAEAIEKAYTQAMRDASAIEVATTLCNGDIDCATLTTDESAKLGACLGYITYTGLYTNDFRAQVDMDRFNELLNAYSSIEQNMTESERAQITELTKSILEHRELPTLE